MATPKKRPVFNPANSQTPIPQAPPRKVAGRPMPTAPVGRSGARPVPPVSRQVSPQPSKPPRPVAPQPMRPPTPPKPKSTGGSTRRRAL